MKLPRRAGVALGVLLLIAGCAPPVPVPLTPSPAADDRATQLSAGGARWTVRIHTDEDPAAAQDVASQAEPRFDVPVRLVRIGGATHVHVGSFATKTEAQDFLEVVRARGYRSAALVREAVDGADAEASSSSKLHSGSGTPLRAHSRSPGGR